jgi:hypothetical protein
LPMTITISMMAFGPAAGARRVERSAHRSESLDEVERRHPGISSDKALRRIGSRPDRHHGRRSDLRNPAAVSRRRDQSCDDVRSAGRPLAGFSADLAARNGR